jgi:uncharacterized cupredoxin-like copper-binding protein
MSIFRSHRRLAGLAACLLMLATLAAPVAAQGTQAATRIDVTITAKDFSFDIPAQVPAGLVDVTMKNDGPDVHHAQIARLNDGVTFDQLKTALNSNEGAALGMVSLQGGPGVVLPGASQEVLLNLDNPGTYAVICFVAGADGIPHFMKGMIAQFEVTGPEAQPQEPESDQTITMKDFGYTMPDQVMAGHHVWKIVNDGPEPHEMALFQLAPGVTADQVIAMLTSEAQPTAATPMAGMEMGTPAAAATPVASPVGAPPFMPAGGMQALDKGLSGWLVVDLTPGNYLALCNVPDPKTGNPHFELGMYKEFTVIETTGTATPVATPVS